MSDLNLKPYDPLYPMRVHPYEELLKDQNASVIDKINSIIVYLNSVGKLTSDVVKNWNTVYNWVMNDGLTTGINNKLEDMLAKHEFDPIFATIISEIGDITTLTTTDKSNLTKAVNELVSKIGDLTTLTTPQKDTIVHSINSLQSEVTTNTNAITTNTANITANTNAIATNTTNIATNTTQLADLSTNAKKQGAKGDGTTDDTTIVQTTVNNNQVTYLPPGTYNLTSLNIPTMKRVKGAGINKTILKFTGTSGNFITMADLTNSISRASLEDVTIDCNNMSTVGLFLRYLTNGSYLRNIELTNVGVDGVDLSEAWYTQFENVRVRKGGSGKGWNIHSDVGQVNSVAFIGCQAHTCGGVGFYVNVGHGCSFVSCQSENNNLEGLQIEGGGGTVFEDFYLENNSKTMSVPYNVSIGKVTTVLGAMFVGGFATGKGGAAGSSTFYVDKAYDVSILGTKLEVMDASARPDNHILATANAQGVSALPVIISNSGVINFSSGVTVFSQRNNMAQFPNGIKVNTIQDNGIGTITANTTNLYVKGDSKSIGAMNTGGTANVRMTVDVNGKSVLSSRNNAGTYDTDSFFFLPPIGLTAKTASSVQNISIFVDSADNKLKFKDSAGVVNLLY